jgi:hypothetical protein
MAAATPQWYVKFKEKPIGPFSHEQLQGFATQGVLSPDHPVSCDSQQWVSANSVKGLTFNVGGRRSAAVPGRRISVKCECANSFDVLFSYCGTLRPCPQCGRKCLVSTDESRQTLIDVEQPGQSAVPLRPAAFGDLTALGAAFWAIVMAFLFVWPFSLQLNVGYFIQLLVAIIFAAPAFVPFVVLLELRNGKRWAWFGIQIVAVTETLFSLLEVCGGGSPIFLVLLVGQLILYGFLLPLLYSPEVQDYCFRARPS